MRDYVPAILQRNWKTRHLLTKITEEWYLRQEGKYLPRELKKRRQKKDKMKKTKEKKEASMSGRETKVALAEKKNDTLGDRHSQRNEDADQSARAPASTVNATLSRVKKQVEQHRNIYVKTKMDANNGKLQELTSQLLKFTEERTLLGEEGTEVDDALTISIQKALCKVSGNDLNAVDKDVPNAQDEGAFLSILSNTNPGDSVKLPVVVKHPPYTTWIFLDRNQRMAEDQSVVGRRRIYYDQNGSEALICSDSEEEQGDDEEEKHEFSKGEDYIIWKAIQEHGPSDAMLKALANAIDSKQSEIEARYDALHKEGWTNLDFVIYENVADGKQALVEGQKTEGYASLGKQVDLKEESELKESVSLKSSTIEENKFDDKDLDAAMDSFDNLFCRRCLVFDCRLHGCSQLLIQPSEKPAQWSNPEGSKNPCGPNCYLLDVSVMDDVKSIAPAAKETSTTAVGKNEEKLTPSQNFGAAVDDADALEKRMKAENEKNSGAHDEALLDDGRFSQEAQKAEPSKKGRKPKKTPKRRAEEVLVNIRKKQMRVAAADVESVASGPISSNNVVDPSKSRLHDGVGTTERPSKYRDGLRTTWRKGDKVTSMSNKTLKKQGITTKGGIQSNGKRVEGVANRKIERENEGNAFAESGKDIQNKEEHVEGKTDNFVDDGRLGKVVENLKWTKLEKGLYEKGLDIFGKNSCLVARNMLKGMKTCREVAEYIAQHEAAQCKAGDCHNSHLTGNGRAADCDDAVDMEVRTRTRFWRRRGRVRRLKYTWKSAGHPAIRKRIADVKDQPCKQYTPCGCQFTCGKQCTCLHNGTCCEKYCGCSKSCKNRFRGCHCAKSQCRSRQCPCFAAGRECDPDVCRNCWVGCGDGTLGGPPQRGDNYECQNMKLLLRQQQRVLLGRSDVAGWGAFLKNSVSRHDYLGEYTGELISHREADKRGKIYDRENSSFLFNLNDQYVLDAYRKGDKLKFANHSPTPNCYAKVIMVAGDHRVGIFAKDRISAGEELFYDYRYEPDRAPVWARKPEGSNSKREEPCSTGGRAQKVA